MKTFERVLVGIIILSLVMKLLHLPLASTLLILASSTLSMCYWLSFLWFGTPTRKDGSTLLTVLGGIGYSIALLGILFKLQYWPLSAFYLLIGSVACIATLIAVTYQRTERPELAAYSKSMIRRTLVIGIPAALLYFTPSAGMVRFQYRDDPTYAELFVRHMEHPRDTAATSALYRYQDNKLREDPSRSP